MNRVKNNILATLAYFDLFKYPLTAGEIYLFLKERVEQTDLDMGLKCLVASQSIYQFGHLYSLRNNHQLIVRRYNGNKTAAEMMRSAARVCQMLIGFPYVRGIAVSGSLSKNYADENSDIDLFIITAKNRLWIARTLMHAVKKLSYLVNKQDYFCMNYYIDEALLEIKEKNFYTAIEVVTLIPLQGDTAIEQFYAANSWTRHYLPNKVMRLSSAKPLKPSWFKLMIEKLFNNALGNAIDNLLMKITARRWQKKTERKKLNAKGSVMAMDAAKHYAKPDPRNFQQNLLEQYQAKITQLHIDTPNLLAK